MTATLWLQTTFSRQTPAVAKRRARLGLQSARMAKWSSSCKTECVCATRGDTSHPGTLLRSNRTLEVCVLILRQAGSTHHSPRIYIMKHKFTVKKSSLRTWAGLKIPLRSWWWLWLWLWWWWCFYRGDLILVCCIVLIVVDSLFSAFCLWNNHSKKLPTLDFVFDNYIGGVTTPSFKTPSGIDDDDVLM